MSAVEIALAKHLPYSVVFIDMRMPPGIDGKETARRIRQMDSEIQIVIVTGYSDYVPQQVAAVAGPIDKLFYLCKPFDRTEIRQLAIALSARWRLALELQAAKRATEEKLALLEHAYSELALSEANARHASLHDPLTGLANRLGFSQELARRLKSGGPTSLLFLDLDRFKQINDTVGHVAGDELVRALAISMKEALPPGSALARLGGDEFGVLISDLDAKHVARICEDLLVVCAQQHTIMGHQLSVTASIGLAVSQAGDVPSESDFLRRADLALYVAKREGPQPVCAFPPGLRRRCEVASPDRAGVARRAGKQRTEPGVSADR